LSSLDAASLKHHLHDEEAHHRAIKKITMGMQVEDRQAHTDHHQWVAMEVGGAVGGRPHPEEDGEEEAEEEEEEDAAVVTLATDPVRTRDPGVGARAGACRDHRTADHLHGHHRAEGAAEVATAGEIHHPEEEGEVVAVEEEAQATTRTTVRGREAGAEIANSRCSLSWVTS
jgi:hypothetical protein